MARSLHERIDHLQSKLLPYAHRLVVISGPSAGAGKGKVISQLLESSDLPLWKSVSMTTRQSRPGEKLHHAYNFVTIDEFAAVEADDGFLEANGITEGNRYGTPLEPILNHFDSGDIVILEIEVHGAHFVHQVVPEALFMFIKPTSGSIDDDVNELRVRITGRGTESAESIERRLKQAREEIVTAKTLGFYDEWIVNATGKSDEATAQIDELVHAHVSQISA